MFYRSIIASFALLLLTLGGQGLLAQNFKPFWADGYFYDAENSYIEVASAIGWEIADARKNAYQEIINRRSLATGTDAKVVIKSNNISIESNHDLIVKSRIVDEYIEQLEPGRYKIYLLVQTVKNPTYNYEQITITDKYPFSVRSFVPGWQQFYKGSKVKGGLIVGTEGLGIGGIITCFCMKASYDKLIQEDPKHAVEYSSSADTWQNVGFGFVAFTAAIYIYNIIDAAVAPGTKRIFVNNAVVFAPIVSYDGSIGLAMKYNF